MARRRAKTGTKAVGEPAPSDFVQAARRIDWRFLLPDPDLGSAVCLGPVDRRVIESLQLFGASVTIFDAHTKEAGEHDVVVLENPSPGDLSIAAGLLRPGGWVYAEITGSSFARARRRLGSSRALAAELAGAGFADVRAYWHFPDAEGREGLVALDDARAIRHVLMRRPRTARAAVREAIARLLLMTRLFAFAVHSASVIGRRVDECCSP
jgi:hypothetical protein